MKKSPKAYKNHEIVLEYAQSVVNGKKIACVEVVQACQRFLDDLKNKEWDFKSRDAEFCIRIIENTFVYKQGERLDGTPLLGEPVQLQPFEKFHVYNLLGFYEAGTNIRRFKEALIMVPRKNSKTTFTACLVWALALLNIRSGSKIYITAAALKQSLETWDFIKWNLERRADSKDYRIIDNNNEHSISWESKTGSLYIQALAASPERQDSLNCNIGVADEIHAYKSPKQYNIIREAMKAYTNKLMIGITTAGDTMNSFGYRRMKYGQKILSGEVTGINADQLYVFIAKAPEGDSGDVDYLNPKVHEMANPSYGVIIRPDDILKDAMEASADPQQRKDFLAKSLNVYTAAMRAYFNVEEFKESNELAEAELGIRPEWTLDKKLKYLAKLQVSWYGGTDLSKLHDLTAASLHGSYKGIDITIPHAWFPIVSAYSKAEEDSIPLFGWQDDGWLTMTNTPTVNYADVVKWYSAMKRMGFKIKVVGHDRRFAKEYMQLMKQASIPITDQRQYDWVKVRGFRHLETQAKNKKLYYLGSEAYEYCVGNVRSIENLEEKMHYEKVDEHSRIDIFDADVMAACQMIDSTEQQTAARRWFGE